MLGKRNGIAHGEKLEVDNLCQFQKLEHAAILVMHELAITVMDCIKNKSYLQPSN